MDPPRRAFDPKVRQVGFITPGPVPTRTQSGPAGPINSPSSISPSGTSLLSPVMIIPPPSRAVNVPRTAARGATTTESVVVGSYNPDETLLGTSPASTGIGIGDGEFSEDSENWRGRGGGGGGAVEGPKASVGDESLEVEASGSMNGVQQNKKSLKEKTTKAERRAMQEAQRAAKAASKGINDKSSAAIASTSKTEKKSSQKKDGAGPSMVSAVASDKKGGERPAEKERKKDTPAPRLQFDDKSRVEKAKRRSLVKQTEARNRVELFLHLPQYEHGSQLPDLESKFFQLDPIHPSIHKVGLQYLAGDIVGENARCIAMLQAFQDAIKDYSTPPEKTLNRDLTAKVKSYVSFLIECRPLSVGMGNAIRYLKTRIVKLPLNLSESEARTSLCLDIERFINEKILLADKVIISHAVTKIRDGDVLLTFGTSSVVEMILMHAYELGKSFRVVVVDSRPKLEGQSLVRRLVTKGLSCTYTHINAASYIMHEVTRVFVGAASVLSNGAVYARVGTASIAMVAHAFRVPVLVCCEAYKFHERVQLDSICCNELGDPAAISMLPGRAGKNILDNCSNKENLQLLNLVYDATPSDYISMVITEYGMIPTTSVPVIVREYGREHLLI